MFARSASAKYTELNTVTMPIGVNSSLKLTAAKKTPISEANAEIIRTIGRSAMKSSFLGFKTKEKANRSAATRSEVNVLRLFGTAFNSIVIIALVIPPIINAGNNKTSPRINIL